MGRDWGGVLGIYGGRGGGLEEIGGSGEGGGGERSRDNPWLDNSTATSIVQHRSALIT